MDFWVTKLREQAARIIKGDYQPDQISFQRAPAGLGQLSRDLDALAVEVDRRELVRKALALEVHHRVKNNLQIVTSLLHMQANRIENPAAREALGQTRARIGALALIHRILYDKNDDGSQATLDIAPLIAELCAEFRLWHRDRPEIALSCEAISFAVPLDSAMPLILFAVEAITNAYAYAFPNRRNGTIFLRFNVDLTRNAVLSITDNGTGYNSRSNSNSMGRQLMNGFGEQLNGTFAIVSSPEIGTDVRLEYPVAASESFAIPPDDA